MISRRMIVASLGAPFAMHAFGESNDTPQHQLEYFEELRKSLGLSELSGLLFGTANSETIRHAIGFAQRGGARIRDSIGDQLHTAVHTLPALVAEDLQNNLTITLEGLTLTQTECALLLMP